MKPLHLKNALLLTTAFFAGGTPSLFAQIRKPLPRSADSIKEATVSVYQSYQPELRPISKPLLVPTTPPADTQTVVQQYTTETPVAAVLYYPVPLKPVALDRDTTQGPGPDYIKIGGGNLGTFLFEGATSRLSTPDIQSLLFIKHLGHAKGQIAAQTQQTTQLDWTFAGPAGKPGNWKAFLEMQRQSYGRYGFNEGNPFQTAGTNVYFSVAAGGSLRTDSASLLGGTEPAFQIRIFDGPQIGSEKSGIFTLPARYKVGDGFTLEGALHTALTSVSNIAGVGVGNSYAQLPLSLNLYRERLRLRAGVVPTLDRQGNVYILPDFDIRYSLTPQRFWVEGGWKGTLLQNRFETLALENPYLYSYRPTQTRARELWAGLGANVGPYVTANIRISDTRWSNLLLYVNTAGPVSDREFYLLTVPKAGAFSLSGSLRYLIGKTFVLEAHGALYGYRSDDVSTLWHLPTSRTGIDFYWQASKNLELQSSLTALGGIQARGPSGEAIDLESVINVSAGTTYSFYKNWALGLHINNLLNRQNERYLGYPAFGFNVVGSVQVRF